MLFRRRRSVKHAVHFGVALALFTLAFRFTVQNLRGFYFSSNWNVGFKVTCCKQVFLVFFKYFINSALLVCLFIIDFFAVNRSGLVLVFKMFDLVFFRQNSHGNLFKPLFVIQLCCPFCEPA